jgi:hypothetical protein
LVQNFQVDWDFFSGSSGSFCVDGNILFDGGAREKFKGVAIDVTRNVVAYLESLE